jgi:hypothetical protein
LPTISGGRVVGLPEFDDDGPASSSSSYRKRRDYLLSEPGEPAGVAAPTDAAQLVDLLTSYAGSQYDRKVAHQIRAELARRHFTIPEYVADVTPHLKRLKSRPGAGFFLHHAQTFTVDRAAADALAAQLARVARFRAAEEKARCRKCRDGLRYNSPADIPADGLDRAAVAHLIDTRRATFCTCPAADVWLGLIADFHTEVKPVSPSPPKPTGAKPHGKRTN